MEEIPVAGNPGLNPDAGVAPRRVVITGSESTGKTTLARELARELETVWVPEFVRGYLDARGPGGALDATDVDPIARGQIEAEVRLAVDARRVLILDTDLVSTEIYATHYYGVCPEWIRRAAMERTPDLYLLAEIDVPWKADPQRDRSERRGEMQRLFRDRLALSPAPVVTVRGPLDARLATARLAVERILAPRG